MLQSLRAGGRLRTHRRLCGCIHTRPHCLTCGDRPLVYCIPWRRALQPQRKRKKSKQQAQLFNYLTGQLLTTALFLPEPLGRGSHVGGIETFHADAAQATAGQTLPTPTQQQCCARWAPTPMPSALPVSTARPSSSPGASRCHRATTASLPQGVLHCFQRPNWKRMAQ